MRDLLLGREPKDFDVATDATPEQVKEVFRNCRLIGRRFRLAHVHFGREIIEVATFRGSQDATEEVESENGMLLRDNVFGTIEEDALRRDFTINALYYNIQDFSVVDYTNGVADLEKGVLKLLGDPEERYREDPVRMLRAIRFAAKLGFRIDETCADPIAELSYLMEGVPAARLFDEVLKLFMGGVAVHTFEKLRQYGLFERLFPETDEVLSYEEHDFPILFAVRGLENTDTRIRQGKPVTPAFLFAVLLWEPVRLFAEELIQEGHSMQEAMQISSSEVLTHQLKYVSLPKRFSLPMREIWSMQERFKFRSGKRPARLMAHPRFRAAYDFLVLRAEVGEADPELAEWWTKIQEVEGDALKSMTTPSSNGRPRRRRRRRSKPSES